MLADSPAADSVLAHFQWIEGDADTWTMLRDPDSLATIVAELATLCATDAPDVIVGIEARGFVVAPLVAFTLGVGFSPLRKGDAILPGPTVSTESEPDYRGTTHRIAARTDHLGPGVRVALVDDWVETGSQAMAARRLIEETGAQLVNVTVIVDEASPEARASLPAIRSILSGNDLP